MHFEQRMRTYGRLEPLFLHRTNEIKIAPPEEECNGQRMSCTPQARPPASHPDAMSGCFSWCAEVVPAALAPVVKAFHQFFKLPGRVLHLVQLGVEHHSLRRRRQRQQKVQLQQHKCKAGSQGQREQALQTGTHAS